jgi:signal transduction histidine kinase
MASSENADVTSAPEERGIKMMLSPMMLGLVWLPIVVITVLHFSVGAEQAWVHGVLRRVYYLPIIIAAIRGGMAAGLTASSVTTIAYLPHAFTHVHHHDPAPAVEKALEIVLYNVVGFIAGYLASLERRRRQELEGSLAEQRRLQNQLVRTGRLAALGEVVAGIAHEIKNPLHGLQGSAEILDSAISEDSEERRIWKIHRRELDRIARVADRFLSFARPPQATLLEIDLREVTRQLRELLDAQARSEGVEILADEASDPVLVHGDRDQLVQLVLNLALNGLRALREVDGGRLSIAVRAEPGESGQHAIIEIENDGPAIPADKLDKIFDPFHTDSDEGTGLGLSICVRIAEGHGGWIEAANQGLGVRFTLTLPVV